MANMAMQDAAQRNNYNLQTSQMRNQWSQNAYGNQLAAYDRLQDYNRYNTQKNLALGAGAAGALGGLATGLNRF